MKRIQFILIIVAAFLGLLGAGGCYKDKGNYNYSSVDTVRIAYDSLGGTYTVLQFDTLWVNPVIALTAGSKESDLSYEWSARGVDPNLASQHFPITVISVQRNLDTIMSLVPGSYVMTYKVTDNSTGISSYLFYTLNVTTSFSEGWLLLEQVNGVGDVAVIGPTGKVLDKVYSGANGASLPADVTRIDLATTLSPQEVYLISANDAVEVSPSSFGKIYSFADWFFYTPTVTKPESNVFLTYSYYQAGVAINNGWVYIKRYGGFPPPVKYGAELLLDGTTDYKMAPYVLGGTFSSSLYIAAVYDTEGKRFVGVRGTSGGVDGGLVHFTAPDGTAAFDPNNVGMDALYMGASRQDYIYNAIMKDGVNGYFYQLNLNVAQSGKLKQQMNAPEIANMTAAVSSLQLDYVYYAAGNKIYMYEIGPNTASVIYAFPTGENITTLNIDVNKSATVLLATTYSGTSGAAYEFNIDVTGKFVGNVYAKKYTGLGKVVYARYKPK